MNCDPLTALSPLDGRYAGKVDALRVHFSEFGLIRCRLRVEIEWLKALAGEPHFAEIPAFSASTAAELDALVANFGPEQAAEVKAIVAGGPGNRSDWVGLYRSAATDTQGGVDERYLNGSYSMPAAGLTSATVTFTAPSTPGTYNFRFFASNGYTRLAVSKSFTVT